MKLSLRRLPQSRIRSTAPSRREPCDVRSSTDKKSYPLFSGGPRLSPTGLWLIFCKMPLPKLPAESQFTASRAKEVQTSPQKISPYSGGVGGIDSPHALVPEVSLTSSPINSNLYTLRLLYFTTSRSECKYEARIIHKSATIFAFSVAFWGIVCYNERNIV